MTTPADVLALQEKSKCIVSSEAIAKALDQLAGALTQTYQDKNPLFLCVMVGALIPTADLLQRLSFPLQIDYIHATRYQGEIQGGELEWIARPRIAVKDRHVVVIEDVLDGGVTLSAILADCKQAGARSVKSVVMVDKQREREPGAITSADFTGIEVPDLFLYGYGMDYQGYLRNIPAIYAVDA